MYYGRCGYKKKLKKLTPKITSPTNVWGKVVLYLKEHRLVALHVACGDITDIEITEDELIVRTTDAMLANMMVDGRRDIEGALRWQGLDLQLKVELKEKVYSNEELDLRRLKQVFGDNIDIEGEEE